MKYIKFANGSKVNFNDESGTTLEDLCDLFGVPRDLSVKNYTLSTPHNNPDGTYSFTFTYTIIPEEVPIEMYQEEDYQTALNKYNKALLYQKWIKANKAQTIKFEMID